MSEQVVIALIAVVPGAGAAWAAYAAARRSAQRDRAEDRASVLDAARGRAAEADRDREAMRAKVLSLETRFDRLRSVLRKVVDALDGLEPDHEVLSEARDALEGLSED